MRSSTASGSRTRTATGSPTAARSWRSTRERRGPGDGLPRRPTSRASSSAGRPEEARAAARPEDDAERRKLPGARTARPRASIRPGSTFKPVTALAAMQERLVSPSSVRARPSYSYGAAARPGLQELGPVREPADRRCPRRSARPATRTSTTSATPSTTLPPDRGHPLQGWASRFGFGGPTGHRRRARAVRPPADAGVAPGDVHGEDRPGRWQIDRLWKPGDSIQLAIGQKDLLVTPLQMVRFYSLIANGGKLVTPHVLYAVDEPAASGPPLPPTYARAAEVEQCRPGRARGRARRPLSTRRTRRTAPPTAVFGNFPVPSRARRARPRRSSSRPATRGRCSGPVLVVRLRAADATDAEDRRLRRDRERRPRRHGGRAGGAQGVRALLPHQDDRRLGPIHSD